MVTSRSYIKCLKITCGIVFIISGGWNSATCTWHGVKVRQGPWNLGPRNPGTWDPGSPLKFKSGIRDPLKNFFCCFFSIRVFFHRHWQFTGQQEKGGSHRSFHSTPSTSSQALRGLFATLHVRWLSRIFKRNACVYQTASWSNLPPYRITIWLIEWWCNVCLFTWWIDSRFLLQRFWHWKPVDLNSHRLSPLYYKRTD